MLRKIIAWAIALAVTGFFCWGWARLFQGCEVYADDGRGLRAVSQGIRTLQPAADLERADTLAVVFGNAGQRNKVDPLLLVAISFRESSLLESVESRRIRGNLGELGLMQCHGKALQFRPADCSHHLVGARCQVETGAAYLAEARRQCGGSWWRWIAAYGMGHCPSESYARTVRGAQRACRYYSRIGGKRWSGCEVAAETP
jgi:hypothetical protein